ncbi:hypothetical protein [Geminocystis sp. NIES-3709]|uniref:hypothetical protein n=1 Tax=Geminocystis sp. NIES-3709 TaxID=1617448 RepID=UPI0005FC6A7C|nr:hypothetical protein [Geminocystis sp. NIES-3709]BAQ63866.1 hypothetical protein GM3709_631 [Geminocystis sp. NIES-3709]
MSESRSFVKSTSYDFEQEVLSRFRYFVAILPPECKIYRETWNYSTVLCLNFEDCPHFLEVIKENTDVLISMVQRFSLATCILFRCGNQLRAWRRV